jgi:hypothetical protein
MLTLDNFSTTQNSVDIVPENVQNYYKLAVVPLGKVEDESTGPIL